MGLRISRFRSLVRHQSPQLLAGLEHRHRTRGHFNRIAGAWIPRHASLPAADLEGAEAAYLYVVLILKCFLDRVQERVDHSRAIFLEIMGPAVRAMEAVTCSTRSAFVMRSPWRVSCPARSLAARLHETLRAYTLTVKGLAHPGGLTRQSFARIRQSGVSVMRSWGGFRVVLDGKDRKCFVPNAFHRSVVEIDVSDLQIARSGDGALLALNREAVVLRCYSTCPVRRSRTGWLPPRCP